MTHTVHPYAHRLGIIRDWKSRWFANTKADFRRNLAIDTTIREFLKKRLRVFYVDKVEITRNAKTLNLTIHTSRPGMVIGRNGEESEKLLNDIKKALKKLKLGKNMPNIKIDVQEVRSPESHASIVAHMVAEGLEKRMPHRRVLKQTIDKVMANRDVEGVRIRVSGRLGGADMARAEWLRKGRVPLQTLRADIDYATEYAMIPQGKLGIKVWIYKGEVFDK